MDKDNIILKHEQQNASEIEKSMQNLNESNNEQEKRLLEMRMQVAKLYHKADRKLLLFKRKEKKTADIKVNIDEPQAISYDELLETSKQSLIKRGLNPDDLDYNDLISEKDLKGIVKVLNEPLPREEKWTKADFIVVFIAAIIGSLADVVLSNRNNNATGQKSEFSEWLNDKFHEGKHTSNAPIDYQGKGFGGGYHRELSKGHDIVRFVDGIKMFKSGQFEGIRYIDGVAHKVIKSVNQLDTPYAQLGTIEAIVQYAEHMFADLFSKISLPFPGYSFLTEISNRNLRKFSADMYHNGFNCKNIIIQSLSTISIEIIIRIYFSIQSVKKYRNDIEIEEDYSNYEALKKFIKPANKEKLNEMLLVAHAIVTAVNVGKIVITRNLAEINITEILAVVRYGTGVLKATAVRNDEYAKIMYHADIVSGNWEELEQLVTDDLLAVINDMPEPLVI